jgi:hypothetical protein
MDKTNFIDTIAPIVQKIAKERGYKYPSAIIAQAICESGWGKSSLASVYNNFFGLKCGSYWNGKSVNMATQEEYTAGTLTDIRDNFRAYDTIADGIEGYFDFIQYDRYSNLKDAESAYDYIQRIKDDGYATSSTYVDTVCSIIRDNNLEQFDGEETAETAEAEAPIEAESEDARDTVARYVIKGFFGNGEERELKLYLAVQSRVNVLYGYDKQEDGVDTTQELDSALYVLANFVNMGFFGNGDDRKRNIYRYIQDRVNELA